MGVVIDFFNELGFNLNKDLLPVKVVIENSSKLNEKLKNTAFFFDSPNQTNTSFYFINEILDEKELKEIRKYVWNENKADLLFYLKNDNLTKLVLQYAKVSPNVSDDDCELDRFNISIEEQEKLDKIQRWKFDSGIFWTNYQEFLIKSKKFKSIDKELVGTLEALKNQLNSAFSLVSDNTEKKEEYVQALIDRTLYIKYLEDNHIINSFFYEHHFKDSEVDYKKLLLNTDSIGLNKLFEIIHNIFNNELFEKPTIPKKYLNSKICGLIQDSLNHNIEVGQLRLFDFRFDIIPVEFISYIYEIFLTDKQKENGIYYTPKKLAQLIVDDIIVEDEIGSVLDPSCGSGMFLITAFQRLLENSKEEELKDVASRIEFRTKLIKDNIFGIEKELTAQRFTLFSLSLQLFRGLEKTQIRDFIADQLKKKGQVELFKKHSFFNNIQHANSLETDLDKIPHKDKTFSYIVGNPPFFEVKNTDEFKIEISFIDKFTYKNDATKYNAKEVVGKHQISQCFFIKIKDWSNKNTKFGFVSNSSNFDNEKSKDFQKFFYSEYGIKKIYELSRVKKILFENASESVLALIFSNQKNDSGLIKYYPVKMGLFSEKPFNLLIIKEDESFIIKQNDLINNDFDLRDFLIGNYLDISLIDKLSDNNSLEDYLSKNNNYSSFKGLDGVEFNKLKKHYNLIDKKINSKEKVELYYQYAYDKFLSKTKTDTNNTPYLYRPDGKISKFIINKIDGYTNKKHIINDNFQRTRNHFIYEEENILLNLFGKKINAVFVKETFYFSNLLFGLKLEDKNYYYLFTAIINSKVIDYFLKQKHQKRFGSNFSYLNVSAIKELPIPKELNNNTAFEISRISKNLTDKEYKYNNEVQENLNELIFDLYDLSYLERQRIKDYFLNKKAVTTSKNEIGDYIKTLESSINIFLKKPVTFEKEHNTGLGLLAIKINLNDTSDTPSAKKTGLYLLNEIFEQNPQENFLASREKIWGKDCIYIIKQDINTNWTKTKAYEDGQEVLKKLMK
nr:N-6 DNA methylase [Polaribacter marinus]